jgi:hypothetical protein
MQKNKLFKNFQTYKKRREEILNYINNKLKINIVKKKYFLIN